MKSKIDEAKELYSNGMKVEALKIVGKFPRLGSEKSIIKLAIDCINNPSFYEQLNYDIESSIENGYKAICNKYKWDC